MITRVWPLTLLVVQLALGFDHSIDLTRCKTETFCYVRESCIKANQEIAVKKLVKYKDEVMRLEEGCDVTLQMKALYAHKLHVMMQVKLSGSSKIIIGGGLKLSPNASMTLTEVDTTLHTFNCGKWHYDESGTAKPTLTCDTGSFTVTGDAQLEGTAECKRSVAKPGDPAEFAWFVGDTELTVAACLEKIVGVVGNAVLLVLLLAVYCKSMARFLLGLLFFAQLVTPISAYPLIRESEGLSTSGYDAIVWLVAIAIFLAAVAVLLVMSANGLPTLRRPRPPPPPRPLHRVPPTVGMLRLSATEITVDATGERFSCAVTNLDPVSPRRLVLRRQRGHARYQIPRNLLLQGGERLPLRMRRLRGAPLTITVTFIVEGLPFDRNRREDRGQPLGTLTLRLKAENQNM